ncbi:MAG: hypothetical protein Fues2KO_23080 [Fuerstiella sp.]
MRPHGQTVKIPRGIATIDSRRRHGQMQKRGTAGRPPLRGGKNRRTFIVSSNAARHYHPPVTELQGSKED